MEPLIQLRSQIEALDCEHLHSRKAQLLTLVDSISTLVPITAATAGNGHTNHQRLSPRENEVMSMILDGRRLKEIASTLDISVKTVTTHRSRLLRKLGLEDNLGLYRYGMRNGLIPV